ncbi:ATP-binding cassette domain-containing protein [Streptomyces sp. NPDC090442]|uniref:ATP-binding cassette domain-containing protein n=1 Tax=Streptomyces sp. NPDC090442 TaxID=3365962 RepID=UPI003829B703
MSIRAAETPAPVLSPEGIQRHFLSSEGEVLSVLDGVSLTVEGGELVCVIGPSGCGKPTLLSVLGGLDLRSVGMVRRCLGEFGAPVTFAHRRAAQKFLTTLRKGAADLQGPGATSEENLAVLAEATGQKLDVLRRTSPYRRDTQLALGEGWLVAQRVAYQDAGLLEGGAGA